MKKLQLAEDLSLPLDAVTQTFLIVGKRGSGKSNTATRFVEQLHHANLPFVVLDPVDTWWGLKAGVDGGKGLDVYVFGGRRQDLPLNGTDGALIAEVLCEHRVSMVLSVKHLSGRERSAFMVAFAQTLFQKWGGGPLHVVLEEAHELAPQMSGGRGGSNNADNEAAMLGAFKRLWKLGRASGIGGTAVTQRPASLSKDITTQSEILIAHRTIGPQDVKAIGEWVKYHGEHGDILVELPTLPTGQAFVWAPDFPEGKPLGLSRRSMLLRETYDSASTPKVGERRVEPKSLAPVDLDKLRAKLATTIEKAAADDPVALRKALADEKKAAAARVAELDKRVVTLTRQLEAAAAAPPVSSEKVREVRAAAATEARELRQQLKLVRAAADEALKFIGKIRSPQASPRDLFDESVLQAALATAAATAVQSIKGKVEARAKHDRHLQEQAEAVETRVREILDTPVNLTPVTHVGNAAVTTGFAKVMPAVMEKLQAAAELSWPDTAVAATRAEIITGETCLLDKAGQLKALPTAFLTVLAQYRRPLSRQSWHMLAGYTRTGDTSKTIGEFVRRRLVEDSGEAITITPAGLAVLGPYELLPSGPELRAFLVESPKLSKLERALIKPILDAYPAPISRDEVLKTAGYTRTGDTSKAMGKFVTVGWMLNSGKSLVRASDELFPDLN